MTLEEVRKICEEIMQKYGLQSHSDYHEGRKGESTLIYFTLKFKIDGTKVKKKA